MTAWKAACAEPQKNVRDTPEFPVRTAMKGQVVEKQDVVRPRHLADVYCGRTRFIQKLWYVSTREVYWGSWVLACQDMWTLLYGIWIHRWSFSIGHLAARRNLSPADRGEKSVVWSTIQAWSQTSFLEYISSTFFEAYKVVTGHPWILNNTDRVESKITTTMVIIAPILSKPTHCEICYTTH